MLSSGALEPESRGIPKAACGALVGLGSGCTTVKIIYSLTDTASSLRAINKAKYQKLHSI